jgi:hypothetical protein
MKMVIEDRGTFGKRFLICSEGKRSRKRLRKL